MSLSSRQNGGEGSRQLPSSPTSPSGALLSLRLDAAPYWTRSPGMGRGGSGIGSFNVEDNGSRHSRVNPGPVPASFRHSRASSPKSNFMRRKRSGNRVIL